MTWILKDEIDNDPLGRGYAGMSDQEISDDMNTKYREVSVMSIPSEEIVAALVPLDILSLTDAQLRNLWGVIGAGSVKPDDDDVKNFFAGLFGSGTTTRANLLALAKQTVSRAAELRIRVKVGLVAEARRVP